MKKGGPAFHMEEFQNLHYVLVKSHIIISSRCGTWEGTVWNVLLRIYYFNLK
jgi:hypothetical protein